MLDCGPSPRLPAAQQIGELPTHDVAEQLNVQRTVLDIVRAPADVERIREALDKPGRTEGVRKIAVRFGVDPSTVQRISRPFDASVGVA